MNGTVAAFRFIKALDANSQLVDLLDDDELLTEPMSTDSMGVFVAGLGNNSAPQQILVTPYCMGAPGAMFRWRLTGWWNLGARNDVTNLSWLPLTLAEFVCTAGTKNGRGVRMVNAQEFFCSDIELVAGTLGYFGGLQTGLPRSWAKIDLQGCMKYSFQFAQLVGPAFGNALFSRTATTTD